MRLEGCWACAEGPTKVCLCLEGGRRRPHVHRDGGARGEVLRVDVEELVHVGGVGDEPLEFEVLVDHGRPPDSHAGEDGEEDEARLGPLLTPSVIA